MVGVLGRRPVAESAALADGRRDTVLLAVSGPDAINYTGDIA